MKIAFVGFGAQTRENLLPTCMSLLGIEVAGLCDNDERKHDEAAALFGRDRAFLDHRTMMETVKPDAVIAACYPSGHFEIACDAIERTIPVFIEKPPAPSSEQVAMLVEAAKRKRLVTGVGMNFRFAEVTRRLKAMADGHFNMMSLRQLANKPTSSLWGYPSLLRSFLHAQTIHGIDMLIYLCGPVRELQVVDNNFGDRIVFTVMMEFESGAHGSLVTSNTSPHFVFDFDAICRDNVCVSSRSLWDLSVTEFGKPFAGGERSKWRESWAPSPLSSGFDRSGYRGQLLDFIAAVKSGGVESKTSFSSLLETYRCLDLIEARCMANGALGERMMAS